MGKAVSRGGEGEPAGGTVLASRLVDPVSSGRLVRFTDQFGSEPRTGDNFQLVVEPVGWSIA